MKNAGLFVNLIGADPSLHTKHVVALGLLLGAIATPAEAVPVYAYSKDDVSAFRISSGLSGQATRSYISEHSATFGGFGAPDSHPRGGESAGDDLPQSKVGPGGFPGENTFTPHGKQGNGYARADTQPLPARPAATEAAKNVAEAYRITPGTASASARVVLFVRGDTDGGALTFFFTATPFMRVMTNNKGDVARAGLDVDFALLFDPEGDDPLKLVFLWQPCGNATDPKCFEIRDDNLSVAGVTDPFDLNEIIVCNGGPCEKTWPADGTEKTHNYEITVNGFGKGRVQAQLGSGEEVNVLASVPEPSTLPLILCGAIGLVVIWLRRSRR